MVYNCLGQCVAMTASEAGQSLTSRYVLDGNALLAATANGQSTYYLPGLAEYNANWNYYLPDGQQSVRQITNASGQVLLNRRFTPWGDVYSQDGTMYQTFVYLDGMLDATTGLIYVDNGQYYDLDSGRFLQRGVNRWFHKSLRSLVGEAVGDDAGSAGCARNGAWQLCLAIVRV